MSSYQGNFSEVGHIISEGDYPIIQLDIQQIPRKLFEYFFSNVDTEIQIWIQSTELSCSFVVGSSFTLVATARSHSITCIAATCHTDRARHKRAVEPQHERGVAQKAINELFDAVCEIQNRCCTPDTHHTFTA
jgi:hypothetical protein